MKASIYNNLAVPELSQNCPRLGTFWDERDTGFGLFREVVFAAVWDRDRVGSAPAGCACGFRADADRFEHSFGGKIAERIGADVFADLIDIDAFDHSDG